MSNPQARMRRYGRDARASLPDDVRELASEVIAEKVIAASWFYRAQRVACYLPAPDEVSTWTVIARGWRMKKRIFAPVLKKSRRMLFQEITPQTDLRVDRFGLYEPTSGEIVTARTLDVVLTPVVAFDKFNHRIGMGGGYFDTTFSFLNHRQAYFRPKLVGLAFACQEVEKITPNPWDIRVFCTITEKS